jgi:hypothetical protein
MPQRAEDASETRVMWLLVLLREHMLIELADHFVPTGRRCQYCLFIVEQQAKVY